MADSTEQGKYGIYEANPYFNAPSLTDEQVERAAVEDLTRQSRYDLAAERFRSVLSESDATAPFYPPVDVAPTDAEKF